MTQRSAVHASFTIDRTFDATPARVFAAWANPELKALWFSGPPESWKVLRREQDFRVGGREIARGQFANGRISEFNCVYFDIVPDERIVYAYDMHIDDKRISTSLATIEIRARGTSTQLVVTEQGVFLDGYDENAQREAGTRGLMDRLGESLRHAK